MTKNFTAWSTNFPETLTYPDITAYEFLHQSAARCPDRIAIVFAGMELTYAELKQLADRFAAALDNLGVNTGDRVAVGLPNCPQFAIAYYAIMRLGAVFTPLSPLLSPEEVAHQLNDAGATVLLSLDLLHPLVQGGIGQTGVREVISTSLADTYSPVAAPAKQLSKVEVPDTRDMAALLAAHDSIDENWPLPDPGALAHLAYTGGTTGVSKAVFSISPTA